MKLILVIDASASLRETLEIVLGGEHVLSLAPSWEQAAPPAAPALVIVGLGAPPRSAAASAALDRVAPGAPLLVLNAPADVEVGVFAQPGRRVEFLPKPFDAYTLRARVRTLLAEPTPAPGTPAADAAHYRRFLEFPFLTASAAAIARQALATDLPVLCCGERGTGALDVARAIHWCSSSRGPFTVLACGDLTADALARQLAGAAAAADPGTLFLADIDAASPQIQHEILALVRGHLPGGAQAGHRILASTTVDLEARTARGDFLADLFYALGTISLPLLPLRERGADFPTLVESFTATLAARLHLDSVTYTEAALTRLSRYLWFGNVAELEAVIGRTLALHRPRAVDVQHLAFVPAPTARSAPAPTAAARPARNEERRPVAAAATSTTAPSLEILIGELAHELRNPMVTIKTFAQHMESVLDDPAMRTRFASLTSDAIARMDALLEHLLDFARFRAPSPQPTDVRALLNRALGERSDDLARKHVRVEHNGAGASLVAADEAQVLFALRSLLEGVVDALVPHEPLHVRVADTGALELVLRAERSTAERLAAYVEGAEGRASGETAPLPIALAAALVGRNGGTLRMRATADGAIVITLTLPQAGTPEVGGG